MTRLTLFKRLRPRIGYAGITATVALFLALGGTSYALVVTGALVVDESLTGADVKNDSLTGNDVAESSLDPATVQRRVSGSCGERDAIRVIGAAGNVTCAGGVSPAGPAGGDLAGNYPNPSLADGSALREIRDDDGTGSGLDADSLDGIDASALVPSGPYYLGFIDATIQEGSTPSLTLHIHNPNGEAVTATYVVRAKTGETRVTKQVTVAPHGTVSNQVSCGGVSDCDGSLSIEPAGDRPLVPSAEVTHRTTQLDCCPETAGVGSTRQFIPPSAFIRVAR